MTEKPEDMPFQAEDIERAVCGFKYPGRALLGHDPGLGKSRMAARITRELLRKGQVAIIVCPSSLKENWRRELLTHVGVRAVVLYGTKPHELPKASAYIVNYDVLFGRYHHGGKSDGWAEALAALDPQMVIIDEIVYIMNPRSKRTRAVRRLCKCSPHVLGLGGTGGMNSKPIEMFSFLNICRPDVFHSRTAFGVRFCDGKKDDFGQWEFKGATHTAELNKLLLKTCMIRRRKRDVIKDLPPERTVVVPIELTKAQKREYDKLVYGYVDREGKKDKKEPWVGVAELEAFASILALTGAAKVPHQIDWIESFLGEGAKLLAFGNHKDAVLFRMAEHFKDRAVLLTGETPSKKRQPLFDAFNRNESVRLFLGQIKAGGIGWSCTSASDVAFLEVAWCPGDHVQAADRCQGIRRGTGMPVTKYWLVAADTVDEDLCRIVQNKQKNMDAVLDGKKVTDMEVYSEFKNALLKRHG